jgi:hypothetical protein
MTHGEERCEYHGAPGAARTHARRGGGGGTRRRSGSSRSGPTRPPRLVEDTPARVGDVLLERAEGNPFFLEELLACIGEGDELETAPIPDSIHAVLAARIDQLPSLEKQALQAASVIGRIFWREAVEALVGGAPANFSCSRSATLSGAARVRRSQVCGS